MLVKNENSVYYSSGRAALESGAISTNVSKLSARRSRIAAKAIPDTVSFRSKGGNSAKHFWMHFGNLSDYMKEPSEMVSAIIQAIGTSIVAPIAILSSPSKNAHTKEEKEAAKEKKVFQAYRQPFSALIALGFQVPATMLIARTFDHFAYEKPIKMFADDTIGNLIPDKKYLSKQARKAMKPNANPKLLEEWGAELEYAKNAAKVKEDLIESIKQKYRRYEIELPPEKIEKMASDKKRITKFVSEKMASAKHEKLLEAKIKELESKHFDIKNIDLVTAEDITLAKQKFAEEFKALKKEKLNLFDNIIKTMGFSNGKIKKYNAEEKELSQRRALELLQTDRPEIFRNPAEKFKQFIKNRDENATKIFKNKKFWIQLVTNLAMVAISCTVLNWMHPKFMDFLEGMKQAKKEEKERKSTVKAKKVEVRA